jgi:hypothetical protein
MSLDRLQAAFAAALVEREAFAELTALFADSDARTQERFALYRANITAACEKALALAFPVTRALVGEEFFRATARAYARVHPSTSGDLNAYGAQYARFVAGLEEVRSLPYLGDVAALEWQVHRARYAADADALARERIARLDPEQLLAAGFSLHPALAWVESPYPIVAIWHAHQVGATTPLPASLDRAESALIARPQWRVEVVLSDAAEIAALTRLCAGADVGGAVSQALAVDAAFDAGQALLRWLDLGLLTGFARPQAPLAFTGF